MVDYKISNHLVLRNHIYVNKGASKNDKTLK